MQNKENSGNELKLCQVTEWGNVVAALIEANSLIETQAANQTKYECVRIPGAEYFEMEEKFE